jgi:D-xylose transport system ATP-binding protein
MRHISKRFPGVVALQDVSLEVFRGETHAIVGENGAGKSTLMKVLSGVYPAGSYEGEILIAGREVTFRSTRDSEAAGIAIIYQELELIKELSVAENVYLGRLPHAAGVVNWDKLYFDAAKLLEDIGVHIELNRKVKDLGVGQQQLVAIAKALSVKADLLILDEPTAALTESEVDLLMSIIGRLKARNVTCILITHKLNEVMAIADRVTVLRDGRTVGVDEIGNLTQNAMIKLMAGREVTQLYPQKECPIGEVVLEVRGLTKKTRGVNPRTILRDISFQVRAGEILGISGLMGAGRTELLMSLFGYLEGESAGEVLLDGAPVEIRHPGDAIRHGMGLVTEDRKRLGLILIQSVVINATLASPQQVSVNGILSNDRAVQLTNAYIDDLGIRTPSADTKVNNLSGGNQQKVLLARCLMSRPKVLFLDEPTRGIDVGAKHEIYLLMNQLAARGTAIVMVSSEMPEIIGMSDRVLVMRNGEIGGEFSRADVTQEKIMSRSA